MSVCRLVSRVETKQDKETNMWLEIGTGGVDFSLDLLGVDVRLGVNASTIVVAVIIVAGLRLRKVLRDKKRKLR